MRSLRKEAAELQSMPRPRSAWGQVEPLSECRRNVRYLAGLSLERNRAFGVGWPKPDLACLSG